MKGFTVDLWLTLFAPKGLPTNVREKLNSAVKTALLQPALKAAFAKVGAEPRSTSPEEGTKFVKNEFDKWKKVIEDAKIKINSNVSRISKTYILSRQTLPQ